MASNHWNSMLASENPKPALGSKKEQKQRTRNGKTVDTFSHIPIIIPLVFLLQRLNTYAYEKEN